MISGLDTKLKGQEKQVYDDLPEGKYNVVVEKIDKWEKQVKKNVQIVKREATGEPVKDDKGKTVKVTVAVLEYYTANVKLKVIDGKHAGRIIFTNLTTHPDAKFLTEDFLYAVDEAELTAAEIADRCSGKALTVDAKYKEYTKTVTNKDTGIDEKVTKKSLAVNKFLRSELVDNNPVDDDVVEGL